MPPPQFYPPPASYPAPPQPYSAYPNYGYPPAPGASYPPPSHKPASYSKPPLALNQENRRGPKGANLALFCIPNAYGDEDVLELAKPYGNPIFCSVARHRDSGASRGYAFVSFETLAEAERVTQALHNQVVEGRAAMRGREVGSRG